MKQSEATSFSTYNTFNQWNSKTFSYVLTISVKGNLKRYINRENLLHP